MKKKLFGRLFYKQKTQDSEEKTNIIVIERALSSAGKKIKLYNSIVSILQYRINNYSLIIPFC